MAKKGADGLNGSRTASWQGTSVNVDQVVKVFEAHNGDQVEAIAGVSLVLTPGEFVAIVGPSGCGKSTLLRIIGGLDHATSGTVTIDGERVVGPNPHHGFVFQRPALFPWLDVLANVTFGPRMQGRGRDRGLHEDAMRFIGAVGLDGFEHHKVYQLSGGMMHRTAIARVLINRPSLMLLDEPFGSLDAQTRLVMQELLTSIWQADRSTMLFITHDVDEALLLSDRTLVMTARPGRIKAEYTVDLPRPRELSVMGSPEFGRLKQEVLQSIHEEALHMAKLEEDRLRAM